MQYKSTCNFEISLSQSGYVIGQCFLIHMSFKYSPTKYLVKLYINYLFSKHIKLRFRSITDFQYQYFHPLIGCRRGR